MINDCVCVPILVNAWWLYLYMTLGRWVTNRGVKKKKHHWDVSLFHRWPDTYVVIFSVLGSSDKRSRNANLSPVGRWVFILPAIVWTLFFLLLSLGFIHLLKKYHQLPSVWKPLEISNSFFSHPNILMYLTNRVALFFSFHRWANPLIRGRSL